MSAVDVATPALSRPSHRSLDAAAFVAGSLAAAVAIAVGEVLAGLISGAPSLVVAIGDLIIDLQPPGAKDVMADLFGTDDKLVLNVLIVVAAVADRGPGRHPWPSPGRSSGSAWPGRRALRRPARAAHRALLAS